MFSNRRAGDKGNRRSEGDTGRLSCLVEYLWHVFRIGKKCYVAFEIRIYVWVEELERGVWSIERAGLM